MAKPGGRNALSKTLRLVPIGLGLMALASCAEVEVGAEAVKAINSKVATTPSGPDPQPSNVYQAAAGSRINPRLEPAPAAFEARGNTVWDGNRTLQGIWVAHPRAETAMRVRVINTQNGIAVDGALFRREVSLNGPTVLVSSEAADALELEPNEVTPLVITALRPKSQEETIAAAPLDETSEDDSLALAQTDGQDETVAEAGESTVLAAASPTETPPSDAPSPAASAAPVPNAEDILPRPTIGEPEPEPEQPVETVAAVIVEPEPEPEIETPQPSAEIAPVEAPAASPPQPQPEEIAALPEPERPQPASPAPAPSAAAPAEPEPEPITPEPQPVRTPEPATIPTPASDPVAEPIETATIDPDLGEDLPTSLFVRAGTFSVRENADRLVTRIRAAGYPAVGRNFTSEGRELTTVTAGPFSTRRDQERALKDIRAMGLTDAFASQ